MKTLVAAAALTAALVAGPLHAACSYPKSPSSIPDGSTATMDQMLAAKKDVDQYNKDMTAYLDCIKLEHSDAVAQGASMSEDQKKELEKRQVQKHNAAIDELEGVAGRFNEQVKAYKVKNP